MEVSAWTDADTEQFLEWFRFDPLLWGQMGAPGPMTIGQVELHLMQRMMQEIQGTALVRAVRQGAELLAYVTVYPLFPTHGICHIVVAPWHRGKGVAIGRAALQAADDLGLPRLIAPPMTGGTTDVQQRWLRRLGFQIHFYGDRFHA